MGHAPWKPECGRGANVCNFTTYDDLTAGPWHRAVQVWDCVAQRIPQRARWVEECAAALEEAEERRRVVSSRGLEACGAVAQQRRRGAVLKHSGRWIWA